LRSIVEAVGKIAAAIHQVPGSDLEDILPVPLLATLPEVRERDKRPSRGAGL